MNLSIRYIGDFAPGTGFNVALRGYLQCLSHLGLDAGHVRGIPAISMPTNVNTVQMPGGHSIRPDGPDGAYPGAQDMPATDWTYSYLHGQEWEDPNLNIVHTHVRYMGHFWTSGLYNVGIVTWETDRLPLATWRDSFSKEHTVVSDLNLFDELWAPTRHVEKVIRDSGVTVPIHVIPHCLLQEVADVPWEVRKGTAFYHMGTWNARKDPEMILQAWFSTGWSPLTFASLSLFCVPPSRDAGIVEAHGNVAKMRLEQILDSLPDPSKTPQFGLHTIYVDYEDVIRNHRGHNCLVSASHGEGFYLPALEAVSLGNRVIGGGPWLEELAETAGTVESGGLIDLLPVRKIPVCPIPEAWGYEVGQKWWSVDQDDLLDSIIEAQKDLANEPQSCEAAARGVRMHYGIPRVARLIEDRLEEIKDIIGSSGW